MAKFTKTSDISGIQRTMEFKQYTQEEFDKRLAAWQRKDLLIQDAFPDLTDNGREFILTGATQEEWDSIFERDESYDDYSYDEPAF